jgi:hypothetical protein
LEDVEEPISNGAPNCDNEMGKTKLATSNNQYHSLLNYLSKNTPSNLRNNLMLFDPQLQMQKF